MKASNLDPPSNIFKKPYWTRRMCLFNCHNLT